METACHRLEEVLGTVQRRASRPPRGVRAVLRRRGRAGRRGRRLGAEAGPGRLSAGGPAAPAGGGGPADLVPPGSSRPAPSGPFHAGPRPFGAGAAAQAPRLIPSPCPRRPGAEALPVRVSAQKLDALLARSGELRVSSLRLEGRAEWAESLREELSALRLRLRGPEEAAARRLEARLSQLSRELLADRLALSQP